MKRSNIRGAKGPCHLQCLQHREGKDEMTKASIDLQDLRRRIYVKAKAEPSWRFWGLPVGRSKSPGYGHLKLPHLMIAVSAAEQQ
ncbi:hypothetical protein ABIF99_011148 [Bradyrhizobium japonicum]|nr:hypothetical protein [Bradyrhizobium japonicum]MCP1866394.1 hypothetical protein [Bradyrhizobium japonicum]MCP1898244.1 hypothetical protein [Bradyrhizobium japonicum]MCW2319376.1 hypothetical protein [Bradyrhizobium japonicum]